jgi:hypothetical protein
MINLILAFVWLGLGLFLVTWHWLHPEDRALRIWNSDISLGWFAIVLALYNLIRWWIHRSYLRRLRATERERQ